MAYQPFSVSQYAMGRPATSTRLSSPRAFIRSMPDASFVQSLDSTISIQKVDAMKSMARLENLNRQIKLMTDQESGDNNDIMDQSMKGEMQLLNSKAMAAVADTLGRNYVRPLSAQDVTSVYRGTISRRGPGGHEEALREARAAADDLQSGRALEKMGSLASKYESGSEGISAVGYDARGGTSYGKYQFSSKAGIVDAFIKHLEQEVPQLAQMLRNAGPANTGGRQGNMPKVWRQIATEHKELFERLQDEFTRQVHLEPAMNKVKNITSLDIAERSGVLQEVLLSTAVQHGPGRAGDIFANAIKKAGPDGTDAQIIENIYADRKRRFGSSSPSVRRAVINRLENEKMEALALLRENVKIS